MAIIAPWRSRLEMLPGVAEAGGRQRQEDEHRQEQAEQRQPEQAENSNVAFGLAAAAPTFVAHGRGPPEVVLHGRRPARRRSPRVRISSWLAALEAVGGDLPAAAEDVQRVGEFVDLRQVGRDQDDARRPALSSAPNSR